MKSLAESIGAVSAVAIGDRKADYILTGCSLINVYTREIQKNVQIAVSGERIAYVGQGASHTAGPGTTITDLKGRYVAPGFADPHIHIDSFVSPAELVKRALLCGTTAFFSEPIDTTSVGGHDGFCDFVKSTAQLPIRIFNVVPGGLPVDPMFGDARGLTAKEEAAALDLDGVLGLGEIFSWVKITTRHPETMQTIARMLEAGCVINGHTAGASGRKLQAYVSSGILSCHEPIDFEQVQERLRLGMWIMIREGSIRRDLASILPSVLSSGTPIERLMFCADELNPADLVRYGHIDHCIRKAIRLGMRPADAVAIASRNCFEYYGMSRDLGGIGPGKLADMVVLDDLESCRPRRVFVGGRLAVSDGRLVMRVPRRKVAGWRKRTVRLSRLSVADFVIKSKEPQVCVNTIWMVTEIITKLGSRMLTVTDGNVRASRDADLWKVAAFDRLRSTKKRAVGFLENFGAEIGALASTRCFHENDLIVIGSNDSDMARAANHLIRHQGGTVIIKDGKIVASMLLRVDGIASSKPFKEVLSDFEGIDTALVDSGCRFARPSLIPTFLPFLALPTVRILHDGIIDVKRREIVPIFANTPRSG